LTVFVELDTADVLEAVGYCFHTGLLIAWHDQSSSREFTYPVGSGMCYFCKTIDALDPRLDKHYTFLKNINLSLFGEVIVV